MTELLRNARMGWEDYNEGGMLMALFFAALLLVWFGKKRIENKGLWLYATVMTLCCVCPVTAVLLMVYQTQFYGYQWVWSAVPVIALTACGIVSFLAEQWSSSDPEQRKKAPMVTALLLVVMLLCGSLGRTAEESAARREEQNERRRAYKVTEELLASARNEISASSAGNPEKENSAGNVTDIVLWAPADIMEYVREYSGEVKLLYGRNMWDKALNAYSYDVYSDEVIALYRKMELWAESGRVKSEEVADADMPCSDYIATAIREGVNTIILPGSIAQEVVLKTAELLNATPKSVEDYWIIYGQAD